MRKLWHKRLERYLKIEENEVQDAMAALLKQRGEKERQVDLKLFQENREAANLLVNREMQLLDIVVDYSRALINAWIEIRQRLGQQCSALLADSQLSALEKTLVQLVQGQRQARREDYQRRSHAAGVKMVQPEQRDA